MRYRLNIVRARISWQSVRILCHWAKACSAFVLKDGSVSMKPDGNEGNSQTPASISQSTISLTVHAELLKMKAAIKNFKSSRAYSLKGRPVRKAAIVRPHAAPVGLTTFRGRPGYIHTKRPKHKNRPGRLQGSRTWSIESEYRKRKRSHLLKPDKLHVWPYELRKGT
jgi:hypothetical protein